MVGSSALKDLAEASRLQLNELHEGGHLLTDAHEETGRRLHTKGIQWEPSFGCNQKERIFALSETFVFNQNSIDRLPSVLCNFPLIRASEKMMQRSLKQTFA